MKNLILSNWNNILFLIFFILMSNSTCYRRNHDGILEGHNVFSLIEARVLGTKSTNGTASNNTVANLTLSSASNSTNSTSVTPNETISMSANVTTNATSSANNSTKDTNSSSNTTSMSQTPNTKTDLTAASNPSQELKDDLNKSKARLLDLEAAIREQAKAFDSLKDISGTVDNLAGKVDQTVNSNEKILVSVKDLKQLYNRIDFKLTTNSIENDNKLNVLNRHLTKNMKNQLNLQVIDLQRDITKTESDIKRLDVKINEIKIKLPNSNSVCSLYNSCGSCVTNSACGWCSLSHQCVDGDSKGPKDGSCSFYDYNICSGPRECSSYSDCDECIKDVACGWCSTSSSPMCMAKSEADKGKCSEDKFVHVWKSLNVCPFISMDNFKAKLIKSLNKPSQSMGDLSKKGNPLALDPLTKSRLMKELKFYQEEKLKNEILLDKLVKALDYTESQLKEVEGEKLDFGLSNPSNSEEKFYRISRNVFEMLKEYIESYVKQTANNSTKAEDKGTIPSQGVSNTTIPKGGSNSTLPTSTVTTEGNNTRSTLSLPANDSMINPSSNASNTNRTSLVSPSDMSSNGTNSTVNSITSNQTATTQTNQTNTNTTMTIEKSTVVNLTNTTHPSIDNATNATKLLQIAKENVLDNNIVMGTLIEKERKMRTLNLRKQTRSIIL